MGQLLAMVAAGVALVVCGLVALAVAISERLRKNKTRGL